MDTKGRDENGVAGAGLDGSLRVKCDWCGCAFFPELQKKREGEIESMFLKCPYCGKRYLVAVSDEKLRMDVAEYIRLVEEGRAGQMSEEMKERLYGLKEKNVARSNRLKEMHPLEDVPSEERGEEADER